MFCMVTAKRVKWLDNVVSCLYLEEIRNSSSDSYCKFVKTLGPLIDNIRKQIDSAAVK